MKTLLGSIISIVGVCLLMYLICIGFGIVFTIAKGIAVWALIVLLALAKSIIF